MALLTTTKYGLRYPNLAEPADLAFLIQALAQDTDAKMVGYAIDVFASRPAAGKAGRRFYASDTSTEYLDDGATWHVIGSNNRIGLYVDRPAANTVAVGTKYFATNQVAEYISDGAVWTRLGVPAGAVSICLAAAADTGYLLLQGQAWPGTTGIYADIYARYGSPGVVPDMQTFVPVGRKAADADFGTLLATLGERRHTLTTAELAAHVHVHNPHRHRWLTTPGGGSELSFGQNAGSSHSYTDIMGGPVTGDLPGIEDTTSTEQSAGSGVAHMNIQPTIVVNFQAKL